jgi:4'-phosphopantetheinyl transferase
MPTIRDWPPLAEPMELAMDDAHAWIVPLDMPLQAHDSLLATLSSDECARAAEFRFNVPRRRFVVVRGTLRQLLGKYLGRQPTDIELTIDANQKPSLSGEDALSGLHFNVSHSGELAMIGFTVGCEVGIDIEQLRNVSHLEQIAQRFFHPSETNAVLSQPESDRNQVFLRCWTGKEAILKALGTGIVGNLSDFQVPIDDAWQGWVEASGGLAHTRQPRCWFEQLTLPDDDYVAAIACVDSKRVVRRYTFAI